MCARPPQKRWPGVPRVLKLDPADKVQLAICKGTYIRGCGRHPPWHGSNPICVFLTLERITVSHHVLPVVCYADSQTCVCVCVSLKLPVWTRLCSASWKTWRYEMRLLSCMASCVLINTDCHAAKKRTHVGASSKKQPVINICRLKHSIRVLRQQLLCRNEI